MARKLLNLYDPKTGTSMPNVEVVDTCGDSDCDGCCTKNAKPSGNLIDMEYWTVKHYFPSGNPEDHADGTLCWKLA
eukprot:CAMPEP_0183373200 /NCGR_PEP_ID=MMETSP0164_2-20130417/110755_1 /TAXON_ID=221442 /ORGANISM="Coccolithus pelagicus ssp braarudi, Strain PLY182g" /LENGTH=75 /DNA_ID=CAMNT_0025550041 /DNA_START=6 /DNA_END=233 /DNA_ORIENTATION=+